MNLMKRDFR